MNILAIDPGVKTGVALSNKNSITLDFNNYDDIAEAGLYFQKFLLKYISTFDIARIVIERPFFQRHSKHTDLTIALIWSIHFIACLKNIPRFEFTADQARKNLIGRARKKSNEPVKEFDKVISNAVKKNGFNPSSEHEADAAALILAYANSKNITLTN